MSSSLTRDTFSHLKLESSKFGPRGDLARKDREKKAAKLRKDKRNSVLEEKRLASCSDYDETDGIVTLFEDFSNGATPSDVVESIKAFTNQLRCNVQNGSFPSVVEIKSLSDEIERGCGLIIDSRPSDNTYMVDQASCSSKKLPIFDRSHRTTHNESSVHVFVEKDCMSDLLLIWKQSLACDELHEFSLHILKFMAFISSIASAEKIFNDSKWALFAELCSKFENFNTCRLSSAENVFFLLNNIVLSLPNIREYLLSPSFFRIIVSFLSRTVSSLGETHKSKSLIASSSPLKFGPDQALTLSVSLMLENLFNNDNSVSKIERISGISFLTHLISLLDLTEGECRHKILSSIAPFSFGASPLLAELSNSNFLQKLIHIISEGSPIAASVSNSIILNICRVSKPILEEFGDLLCELNYFKHASNLLKDSSPHQTQLTTIDLLIELIGPGGTSLTDILIDNDYISRLTSILFFGEFNVVSKAVLLLYQIVERADLRHTDTLMRSDLIASLENRLTVKDNETVYSALKIYTKLLDNAKKTGCLDSFLHKYEANGIFESARQNADRFENQQISEQFDLLREYSDQAEGDKESDFPLNNNTQYDAGFDEPDH
ncbi:uncharacterized protein LOC141858408 [Brevipalpus obovatus]|uniref:uncharacterized protein LOC141858408 n=1 Tax=Brevipalpus obovatus TaxID=246614 RepID=UPI003D9E3931